MDGQNALIIPFNKNLKRAWPNTIILNPLAEELFCIDARLKYIYKMDYNGHKLTIIPFKNHRHISRPFDLDFLPKLDIAIWSDQRAKGLFIGNSNIRYYIEI